MFRIDFNKLRFLVCDDNPHMRRILRTLLHSFGAREVYESEDGATALEMYSHYVPDIVITDWSMPIFDGLELAQMIRQPDSKGNPFAPIIMLTGHSEKRRGGGAPDAGGAQILPTSRFRPRGFTSAFSTSSPIRARSSGPRPISDRTAGATPATPISAPSAASAARWKSFSNPRCSTRPGPPFDARRPKETMMAKDKPAALQIATFADHHVITQPNPLRKVLRRVVEKDLDDPVARAEKALAGLSGEFKNWMGIEAERLAAAHAAILKDGFTNSARAELFRAA